MEQLIITNGESTVYDTPDEATIDFSITAQGNDQQIVTEELRSQSDQLIKAVEDMDISTEIYTNNYNINNIQDSRRSDQETEYKYKGHHSYNLTLDSIAEVGYAIDVLVTNGASRINRVNFELSEDTYEDLRSEAIKNAVQNAREEAETAASAENLNITGVSEMTVDRTHSSPVSRSGEALMAMSAVDDTSTEIKNDDVSVSATVSVEYRISE